MNRRLEAWDTAPPCPPECDNGDFARCPRCWQEFALGCPHGSLCPDHASEAADRAIADDLGLAQLIPPRVWAAKVKPGFWGGLRIMVAGWGNWLRGGRGPQRTPRIEERLQLYQMAMDVAMLLKLNGPRENAEILRHAAYILHLPGSVPP